MAELQAQLEGPIVRIEGWPERCRDVLCRDAFGKMLPKVVVRKGDVGRDFPCVAVVSEAEWELAAEEDREPEWVPWPIEDVFARND